jgi:cell division initiation protein
MKITPLEIRQKTFEKAFRGLDKDEVAAFLLSLSHQWERMLDENKDLKILQAKLEKEVQKLRDVETTLFRTLKTAEETGATVVSQANRTAELHLKEAQVKADGLVNDSNHKAKAIIEKAEMEARNIMSDVSMEVKDMEENFRIIENQRDNVISQLKMLSGDVMSKVEKMKDQESGIETHLKRVKQMLRESSNKVSDHVDESKVKVKMISETPVKQELIEKKKPQVTDAELIKQNHIVGKKPIARVTPPAPVNVPPRPAPKVATKSEASFFDELED